jgi:hypothetical protein
MDFDDLKSAWQAPDRQPATYPPLAPSLVHVLIQQRSRGRLDELQRSLAWQGALAISSSPFFFWLVWLNPFGLRHWYSFVPSLGWASALLLLGVVSLVERWRLLRRTRELLNLRQALEVAIAFQRRALVWQGRLGLVGQLCVFVTIGASLAERGAQLGAWETVVAWGSILLFASLTVYHFQAKLAPRVARLSQEKMGQWLAELAELQATID